MKLIKWTIPIWDDISIYTVRIYKKGCLKKVPKLFLYKLRAGDFDLYGFVKSQTQDTWVNPTYLNGIDAVPTWCRPKFYIYLGPTFEFVGLHQFGSSESSRADIFHNWNGILT